MLMILNRLLFFYLLLSLFIRLIMTMISVYLEIKICTKSISMISFFMIFRSGCLLKSLNSLFLKK